MDNYGKMIEELTERAIEDRSLNLHDYILREDLRTYRLEELTILEVDTVNTAVVPCRGYMILARERCMKTDKTPVAEYAIYTQKADYDAQPLFNSLSYASTYILESICDRTFENMAFAIADAAKCIADNTLFDDPIEMLMNLTNPCENWTLEDAGHILSEAIAQGWHFAPDVDPQMILDIYNDLNEEEEDEE